jgi:hypothetical protein
LPRGSFGRRFRRCPGSLQLEFTRRGLFPLLLRRLLLLSAGGLLCRRRSRALGLRPTPGLRALSRAWLNWVSRSGAGACSSTLRCSRRPFLNHRGAPTAGRLILLSPGGLGLHDRPHNYAHTHEDDRFLTTYPRSRHRVARQVSAFLCARRRPLLEAGRHQQRERPFLSSPTSPPN